MFFWQKAAAFAAAGAVLTGVGVAQRTAHPRGERLRALMRELKVTPVQGRALRSAAIQAGVERRSLDLEELSASERRQRLFQLRRDFFRAADRVLSAEQKQQLKAKWTAGQSERREAFARRAKMAADKLGLSEEQRSQAREILRDTATQALQLKDDHSQDDPTRLAKLAGFLEDGRAKLFRVLTPQQKAHAKELLAARWERAAPNFDFLQAPTE
jgi:hypothetical protein